MANNFEFYTGLRGYHAYSSNPVSWKPYVGQKITFRREHNNPYDKSAAAGKVTLKGKIGLLLGTYQKSSLDISGFLLGKGLNLKLKFTKKNQWLLH